MQKLGFVVVLILAPPVHAGPLSNPAFLGIAMGSSAAGFCAVTRVTKGTPAAEAGLRTDDLIIAINNVRLPPPTPNHPALPCDFLRDQIVSNLPGDVVRLEARRGGEKMVVNVPLSTRAEVLHRRFVGHTMDPTELSDVDDAKRSYDLADRRGRTTVIGWFLVDHCVGCVSVFERVADGLERRDKGDGSVPFVLAVTPRESHDPHDLATLRKGFTTGIALAVADNQTFEDLAIDDPERIHFMVIDGRGVVRFVAPVAPDGDDLDAAVDEVLAAAEQAEHARVSRR